MTMTTNFSNVSSPWNKMNEQLRRLTFNDPSLSRLRISPNRSASHELRSAAMLIASNNVLKDLCFHDGTLSIDAMSALAYSMRHNTSIEKLRLENVRLSTIGAKTLFDALRDNRSLTELHLHNNGLDRTMVKALQSLLQDNDTIKVLVLKQNNLEGALLCGNQGKNSGLKQLELADCCGCAPAIHDMLHSATGLKRLYLMHNELTSFDCASLFRRLLNNTAVEELVIAGNVLDNDAPVALAALLASGTSALRKLCLWGNQLGDAHAVTISQGLGDSKSSSCTISELRLVENKIGDAGAEALSAALLTNTRIELVDLSDNKITNTGGRALLHLIKHNAGIESMVVRGNAHLEDSTSSSDSSIAKEIGFYERLHRLLSIKHHDSQNGRRRALVFEDYSMCASVCWPMILAKVTKNDDPDLLYFVLRQRPDLLLLDWKKQTTQGAEQPV